MKIMPVAIARNSRLQIVTLWSKIIAIKYDF